MDDLRDVSLFVEVARRRSFRLAAERLGLPSSTLSRRIAELEAGLGTKLFVRTTRRVDLTEAGTLFLARCEEIVEAVRGARAELADLTKRPRGTLRVSLTADFGVAFLAPVIARFVELYPEIDFRLDLTPRRVDLFADGFDIAFRIGEPEEPYLYARRLILAERGLYASASYLNREGSPAAPADLVQHRCLTVGPGERSSWVLHRGDAVEEVEVRGPVRANAPGMVLRLALEGMGIIAVDEVLSRPHIESGELTRVLPEWGIRPIPIHALTATKVHSLKTRLFLDFVQAALKGRGLPDSADLRIAPKL